MASSKRDIRLTPPPRPGGQGVRDAPVSPGVPKAPSHPSADGPSPHRRWITAAAFGTLGAVAIAVVFFLPGWVDSRRATPDHSAEEAAAVSSTGESTAFGGGNASLELEAFDDGAARSARTRRMGGDVSAVSLQPDATTPPLLEAVARSRRALREQAYIRQQAEEALAKATEWQRAFEEREVDLWAADKYAAASALMTSGDERLQARDYDGALENFEAAIGRFERMRELAAEVVRQALADGTAALSEGHATAAAAAFRMAASIDPGNQKALKGLQRAEVADTVIELLETGADHERSGDLRAAANDYRQAQKLDPESDAASGLARVNARIREAAFAAAMSDGLEALDREDFDTARAAFEKASGIKPGSEQSAAGRVRAETGRRIAVISAHRQRAKAFEDHEQWREAATEYQAVLGIDGSLKFAQEGARRSKQRAELSERLDYHLAHPGRLSDEEVFEEAETLLADAEAIPSMGPRLHGQIDRIQRLLVVASTPIRVELRSDTLTDVTIYRVGHLGTFSQHALELKPGTYTVVGSRRGYRDVRHELVVAPNRTLEPLDVRCSEEI